MNPADDQAWGRVIMMTAHIAARGADMQSGKKCRESGTAARNPLHPDATPLESCHEAATVGIICFYVKETAGQELTSISEAVGEIYVMPMHGCREICICLDFYLYMVRSFQPHPRTCRHRCLPIARPLPCRRSFTTLHRVSALSG